VSWIKIFNALLITAEEIQSGITWELKQFNYNWRPGLTPVSLITTKQIKR